MENAPIKYVKKDNALVSAAYSLSLSEQRLILLASTRGESGASALADVEITAAEYSQTYGMELDSAYKSLADASTNLFERKFSFNEKTAKGHLSKVLTRWVSRVEYVEGTGTVKLAFTNDVIPLLTDLKNKFTLYAIAEIAKLNSTYAHRLYEHLVRWRSAGKTPLISVADLRVLLGVEDDEYPRMFDFKKRVLDFAVSQVNTLTDLHCSYDQQKKGRVIVGFVFHCKDTKLTLEQVGDDKREDDKTIDWVNGKPDCEITEKKAARKRITRIEAGGLAKPGESWPDLYKRLSADYIIVDQ